MRNCPIYRIPYRIMLFSRYRQEIQAAPYTTQNEKPAGFMN